MFPNVPPILGRFFEGKIRSWRLNLVSNTFFGDLRAICWLIMAEKAGPKNRVTTRKSPNDDSDDRTDDRNRQTN
jgi:hypothetical protein